MSVAGPGLGPGRTVGPMLAWAVIFDPGCPGAMVHRSSMYSAVSSAAVSPFPSSTGTGLQTARFGPGQGGAALRALRQRLRDEQGEPVGVEDDALEMSATTVAVVEGGQAVAALRLHAADTPPLRRDLGTLLHLERFAGIWPAETIVVGSRLNVLADYRIRPVMDTMLRETYRLVRDSGVRFGLINCAPELQALFAFYGFHEYLPPAILPGGNAVLRMALVCEYATGFRACGSPLLDLVQQPELGQAGHAWLVQAFPMLG